MNSSDSWLDKTLSQNLEKKGSVCQHTDFFLEDLDRHMGADWESLANAKLQLREQIGEKESSIEPLTPTQILTGSPRQVKEWLKSVSVPMLSIKRQGLNLK
jgi:hypothetical protein